MFFVLFFQLVYVDWFAIFQDNVGFLNSWKMVFPDISGAADRHRDDRTVCLCGNFEAALMEWKHVQFIFIFVSCTLWENADGNAGFHFLNSSENGFQSLLQVITVKKQAVKTFHPGRKQRNLFHLFFCDIAGTDGAAWISDRYIKKASVISDIKNRHISWYIFLSDNSQLHTGYPQDKTKYCLNDPKRADFLCHRIEFADDPFYKENGNG